jgi:hypothetical protein
LQATTLKQRNLSRKRGWNHWRKKWLFVTGVNVDGIAPFSQIECLLKRTFSREEYQCLAAKQQRINTLYCRRVKTVDIGKKEDVASHRAENPRCNR